MATIWKLLKLLVGLAIVGSLLWIIAVNYSVIFSKTVRGEVTAIERVEIPVALVSRGEDISSKVFSFAVGIKDEKTGEIFTASSEDRQWAVVRPGQCAEAVYLPYPPWDFRRKGTYYGARLVNLSDCPVK